jgi:arsenite methyltransferase
MVAVLGFSREQIIDAVQDMYTEVARAPKKQFHFPTGRSAARFVGYPEELLEGIPDAVIDSFAGVGCPFRARVIKRGDRVLDLGAGAGTDALIASRLVGPQGQVYALDITAAMLAKLKDNAARAGAANVYPIQGSAERLPLPDASIDVVTSNGALNLVPDKHRAAAEIARVLRPGGHVQLADIVIARPVGAVHTRDPAIWAECVVGATVKEDYLDMFRRAGLSGATVLRVYDYFAGSPSTETRRIAGAFGAQAVEVRMQRLGSARHKLASRLSALSPLRWLRLGRQRGLLGTAFAAASLLACYGILTLLAAFAVLGHTLPLDETVWAAAIAVLALLAPVGIALNRRWYGSFGPLALAAGGVAIVLYALFVDYDWRTEAGGFLLLAAGALWDLRLYKASAAC